MYAEEFILIPKRMYMSKVSSAKREILENTNIKQKSITALSVTTKKVSFKTSNHNKTKHNSKIYSNCKT